MRVLVCSTSLGSGRGGIAKAAESFIGAIRRCSVDAEAIATHVPGKSRGGNILVFAHALMVVGFLLVRARLFERRRVTLYLHCGPAGSLVRKFILALLGVGLGADVVTHHHSPKFATYLIAGGLYGALLRGLARLSCRNLVLSDWWRDLYLRSGINKVFTIPNCLEDPGGSSNKSRRSVGERAKRLVTISRLVAGKNVELVVDAMRYLPVEYVLSIGGDGPLRGLIEARIKNHCLKGRVEMLGWIDERQKATLFQEADLFVLPSEYDSFGMVFVEALSYGVPVLAAKIPAVAAALRDCVGVKLIDAWDSRALAHAVMSATSEEYDFAEISRAVLARYGVDVVAERLVELLACPQVSVSKGS